jgi:aerobic carbon-monoxide dehydrogenase medium subunit
VKPAAFDFHRASSLDDALALLQEHPDAKPLAGGQSLIPAMNFRLAVPPALVDLNRVAELSGITPMADGGLRIGAMTRHAAVERSELVRLYAPLLAETMPHVAHPQIRTRGTLGGSLAHADPSAELPSVMVALNATFILRGTARERRIKAAEFFTGLFATALSPGELMVGVEIPPRAPRGGSAFLEVARRHGDYALCGVAAEVSLDDSGKVRSARVALLSIGDGPVLARGTDSLIGQVPSEKAILDAAEAVREEVDPPSDIHADAKYRRQLAGVLTRRALTLAVQRTLSS